MKSAKGKMEMASGRCAKSMSALRALRESRGIWASLKTIMMSALIALRKTREILQEFTRRNWRMMIALRRNCG
jgi:hypothetical protein